MSVLERFCHFYQQLGHTNLSELHSIYTEDVCFIDPIATHHGLPSVEKYFKRLMTSTRHCQFDIHNIASCGKNKLAVDYVVAWTMLLELNNGRQISLDGLTELKVREDGIFYHRDYYDLGQMIYEHIPLLGRIIRFIKRRLSI
jgi:limonene-1,2-epoxide hydrolase